MDPVDYIDISSDVSDMDTVQKRNWPGLWDFN